MEIKISNKKIMDVNQLELKTFPKYSTQIINLANGNAQGTRPIVVGQLSDLFPEFMEETDNVSVDSWREWYFERYPNAVEDATQKILKHVENLKQVMPKIEEELIRSWVVDLLINKTYSGLYFQKAILFELAKRKNTSYRLATPEEESRGIDGYVGDEPYQIKPLSHKYKGQLHEQIDVKIIYYDKTKNGIIVELDD